MKQLLSELLLRTEEAPESGAHVLYECRHCGAKFDEERDRCAVCEASEIATYSFATSCENGEP